MASVRLPSRVGGDLCISTIILCKTKLRPFRSLGCRIPDSTDRRDRADDDRVG